MKETLIPELIKIYQLQVLHKKISDALNVVISTAENVKSNKRTHTILFSTDLNQSHEKIRDYYSLRFQIEFNFRDAKQYFGLEDFMYPKGISSLRSRQYKKKKDT